MIRFLAAMLTLTACTSLAAWTGGDTAERSLVHRLMRPAPAAAISHIGLNQKVLVICVRWSDVATTRMPTCADWVNVLQSEVNTFYDRATFGQTTFQFSTPTGGPADGWYDLGYASAAYNFFTVGQDAINLADPNIDFSQFHRVAVITNFTGFGGQGGGPWWWKTTEGIEANFIEGGVSVGKRLMTLSIVNEWLANSYGNPFDEAGSVVAHELGHHLGVPTHYADVNWYPSITRDVITPWDIMGLSPTLNHFLGWPKTERTWVPAGRIQTVGPPVGSNIDTTITLTPLETGTGTQVIRIPFSSSSPFSGYFVENRQQINGDENLPSHGVLVSLVDTNPTNILKTIVLDDPGSVGDLDQAPLEVGDTFQDPSRNLTLTFLSQTANNASVRVQYGLAPASRPNPQITPWGAPPWETTDIWIDSSKNGWGAYRYTDGAGRPAGNGDDAWVNHLNRVYARVTNTGPGVAANVRAEVYANSPPGMGDAGPDWAYLGTVVFPSIAAGASAEGFVSWTPTVGAHTCIKVVILDLPGELTTTDNRAQENVTAFDTSTSSPYKPVCLRVRVNNPYPRKTPVRVHVRDVPEGWTVLLEPQELTLDANAFDHVLFVVFPGPMSAPGKPYKPDDRYRPGFIGKPRLEAQVPFGDTFIAIGGIDVWTHLVEPTRLTCEWRGARRAQAPAQALGAASTGIESMAGGLMKRKVPPAAGVPQNPDTPAAQAQRTIEQSATVLPMTRPLRVAVGGGVTLTGELSPPVGGAMIAVEHTLMGRRQMTPVKTDDQGRWAVTIKAPVAGMLEARAYFAGDATRGPAESGFCRAQVGRGDVRPPQER